VVLDIKILKVKKDVKYRLVLIRKEKRVLGYDNSYPEQHHKHIIKGNKEVKVTYRFVDA